MASKRSSAKQNTQRSSTSDEGSSNYAIAKSFGGYHNFMRSYGLKPGRDDDEHEASLILDAFREADRECASQSEAGSGYGSDDASVQGSQPASDDGLDSGSICSQIGGYASSIDESVASLESYQSFVAPYDSEQGEDDSDEAVSSEAHDPLPFHDEHNTYSEGGSVNSEHAVSDECEGVYYSDGFAGSETTSDPSDCDRDDSDSYDVDGDSDGLSDADCDDCDEEGNSDGSD